MCPRSVVFWAGAVCGSRRTAPAPSAAPSCCRCPCHLLCHLPQEDSEQEKLVCNISMEVNHMHEGIHLGMRDDREKRSEALGRCGG